MGHHKKQEQSKYDKNDHGRDSHEQNDHGRDSHEQNDHGRDSHEQNDHGRDSYGKGRYNNCENSGRTKSKGGILQTILNKFLG